MDGWKLVGQWWHGPEGERIRAISGGYGSAGGGGIGGVGSSTAASGGGGSTMGALGAGQNIDFTFGQGKVDEDRKKNVMGLLTALIGMPRSVATGQSPGPANPGANKIWDPAMAIQLGQLLHRFGGGPR